MSFNMIKTSVLTSTFISVSFNLFNIKINLNKKDLSSKESNMINDVEEIKLQPYDIYKEYKTLLGGSEVDKILNFKEDVNAYLFICKETRSSAWHLVTPIIQGVNSKKVLQYRRGCFALQGCGGGLSCTKSLIFYLRKIVEEGYQVNYIPKIISN